MMKQFPSAFGTAIPHTTRPQRDGESPSSYHFTTRDAMQQMIEDGKLLSHSSVSGNLYGTALDSVRAVRDAGRICVIDADAAESQAIRGGRLAPRLLFVAPPDLDALEDRLRERGDPEAGIARALDDARGQIEVGRGPGNFDAVLVNEVLEDAFAEAVAIFEGWYPHLTTWNQDREEEDQKVDHK